jgi:hypothetical protein
MLPKRIVISAQIVAVQTNKFFKEINNYGKRLVKIQKTFYI